MYRTIAAKLVQQAGSGSGLGHHLAPRPLCALEVERGTFISRALLE